METTARAHPPWLVQRVPAGKSFDTVKSLMNDLGLHTVCQSAGCPNMGECFAASTATFMILGKVCTRQCRFCAVTKGEPIAVDCEEPGKVARAAIALGLKHVVITSVTRDDLDDGGANQFAACISELRKLNSALTVEVLVPDFGGSGSALQTVLQAVPEVFNHNIETVPRLYAQVRPQALYKRSLEILGIAAQSGIGIVKSGIMVGLGETSAEVLSVFQDWRKAGVTSVTIGQYLRPSLQHLPVAEYVTPAQFLWYEQVAYKVGFTKVASGPLVRSSYHAADFI